MVNAPQGRDYQLDSVAGIKQEFRSGNQSVLTVLPTGMGKTTVLALVAQATVSAGNRIWAIAHREELVKQIRERCELYSLSVGTIHPQWHPHYQRPVQSCMVQTLVNRLPKMKDSELPQVVFVDEAHRAISPTYVKVLAYLKDKGARIIGLTATPWRLDKKPMGEMFNSIVAPISISDGIHRGFLLRPRYFGSEVDLEGLKTKGNDFDEAEMFKRYNSRALYSGTVKNYLTFGQGLPCVCYCVNVEHSLKTAEAFQAEGISAVHVDGETPTARRKQILADFAAGKYQVLCNNDLFTEGLDIPAIGCILLNRATQSLSLYIQMVGRGARPIAGQNATDDAERVAAVAASSKPRFVVIDQGSNLKAHGFWEDEREYSLEAPEKKKKKGANAALDVCPMKECPSCRLYNKVQARQCEECGHEWPQSFEKAKETEMVEIRREEIRVGGLLVGHRDTNPKSKAKTQMPDDLAGRSLYSLTEEELRRVARCRGYHPRWVSNFLTRKSGAREAQAA